MPGRLYGTGIRLARGLAPLAAPFSGKLKRGIEGRREAVARLSAWAAASRDPARPLVWVHAPSVGEALMGKAIMAVLRERRPELQLAFTHFSPSAERLRGSLGADVFDYLPWDLRGPVAAALDALRPAALVFVRTEIWPELVTQAAARGVPSLLVNAVLSPDSGRLGVFGRRLLGPAYASLAAVGAVSDDDARLFPRLGVGPGRVQVTGDARFDQVQARIDARGDARGAGAPPGGGPAAVAEADAPLTVVAGSTWPADHARLVPAFAAARAAASGPPPRLVIAPHEPDEGHLRELEKVLARAGIESARLSAVSAVGPEALAPPLGTALIIDRMGVLADAYAAGDVAYVGGGFGHDGLHSVIEPAALGVPVLFGPNHGNAREADALARAGGGFVVRDRDQLRAALIGLDRARADARERGERAREFVRASLGGAARNAELVLAALP